MVNVNNLRRKRNAAGTTSASLGAERRAFQVVEEIINKQGLTVSAETVRREIRQHFKSSTDEGIEHADAYKVPLIDPISRLRIRIPVQSTECNHFKCFDLYHFLEFSFKNNGEENKNAWLCPHCQAEAKQEQLRINGYFQEILINVGPEPLEVELLPNGEWREVEQHDIKEVLLDSIDEDIVPRKKTKILEDNVIGETSAQLSNSSFKSAGNESDPILNVLRELLGTGKNEDIIEAVQNLMQKLETLEKSAQPKPAAEFSSQTERFKNSQEIACQTEIVQSFQETACQTETFQVFHENSSQTETNVFVLRADTLRGVLGMDPDEEDVLEAILKLKRQAKVSEFKHTYTLNELRKIVGENEPSIIEAVRQLKEKADAWEKRAFKESKKNSYQEESITPPVNKSPDKSVNLSNDWADEIEEEFCGFGEENFEEKVEKVVVNETPPESPYHIPLPLELLKNFQLFKNAVMEIDSCPASTNKESPLETQLKSKSTKITQQQNPVNPSATTKENPKKIETSNPADSTEYAYPNGRTVRLPVHVRIQKRANRRSAIPGENCAEGLQNFSHCLNKNETDGHLICVKGTLIAERYEVGETLGKGEFATVVRVWDRKIDYRVQIALKIFKNTSECREAAHREIDVLNLLEKKDPHGRRFLQLFDSFDFHDHKCLLFELLGPSVHDFMRENDSEPFPMDQIREISLQLIQAVKFLHDNKLSHMNLKPQNVLFMNGAYDLVTREGKPPVKVIHVPSIRLIGLDSALGEHDIHSAKLSTRPYYAPEIITGEIWSKSSDVWSIGCIMFELYTGKTLFPASDQNVHLAMIEKVLGKIPFQFKRDVASELLKNCQSLNNQLQRYKKSDGDEDRDFFALLREMLDYEMDSRIVLDDALKHRYFSRELDSRMNVRRTENRLGKQVGTQNSVANLVKQMVRSLKQKSIPFFVKILLIGNASPGCTLKFLRREQGRGTELVNYLQTELGINLNHAQLHFNDPRSMISVRYRTKAEVDKIHAFFHGKALYGVEFSVSRSIERNEQAKWWQSRHAFEYLAECPQFQKIRKLVQQNPTSLREIIEEIAKIYLELSMQIRYHQEKFLAMLGKPIMDEEGNDANVMKLDEQLKNIFFNQK